MAESRRGGRGPTAITGWRPFRVWCLGLVGSVVGWGVLVAGASTVDASADPGMGVGLGLFLFGAWELLTLAVVGLGALLGDRLTTTRTVIATVLAPWPFLVGVTAGVSLLAG